MTGDRWLRIGGPIVLFVALIAGWEGYVRWSRSRT
jgi:hypothetical protein